MSRAPSTTERDEAKIRRLSAAKRAFDAMMTMKKIDIEAIEAACYRH